MASPISFTLDRIQLGYEAEFLPPLVEIASYSTNLPFWKMLTREFVLKIGEITFNSQSAGRNLMSFRKWQESGASYDFTLGTDGLSFNYYVAPSLTEAWDPVPKMMTALSQMVEPSCSKQVLKIALHCAPIETKGSEFIKVYNTFESDMLSSKGLSFMFNNQPDSTTFLVLDQSVAVTDGLFVIAETTYGPFQSDIFEKTMKFLEEKVFPALKLKLESGVQQ